MELKPSPSLSEPDIRHGMRLVVRDGLYTEAMTTFTGGTFLVAIAVYLGASNIQIGLLASLPAMTNVFQLLAIWLVRKYRNRRAISVISLTLARLPLLVIGALPFISNGGTSINTLIFLLVFHYFFGSLSGPGWNAWMKDLVPPHELGTFFAHRSRLLQILNVILSLSLALVIDHAKLRYPDQEVFLYALMFLVGGTLGLAGVYYVSKTPEPEVKITGDHILGMLRRPFRDINFRRLLYFQVSWTFALNIAVPFYSVFILRSVGLPLSYLIGFNLLTQLSSIISIRMWGRFSDLFSNKAILKVCAPAYAMCILCWPLLSLSTSLAWLFPVLSVIHVVTGLATAGINLSLGNIGLKLAPRDASMAYIVARSMALAAISSLAPLAGGFLADIFQGQWIHWDFEIAGIHIHVLDLKEWAFLFPIGSLLAMVSLRLLRYIREEGESDRAVVVGSIRKEINGSFTVNFVKIILFKPSMLFGYLRRRIRGW